MPISYREVEYKRNKRFDRKLDKREPIRATIVDELGLDTGSGNIWADENLRRVWIRELGTAGASQVVCYNITPEIGLGVIVGYEPYSDIREVLSSDKKFLGQTNPDGRSYESPSTMDFRPGGRFQLWLASKLIEPLATYPTSTTGLTVNVTKGDYPYAGTRKAYGGAINIPLTPNPNPGEHYYAGLYLDSANTLQVVYGASVVLATTPPEPTWPAGAFRLSVVRVNDTQTNITLSTDTDTDNDIFDRRMPWSDEHGGGWPFAHVLTVSTTDSDAQYTTIAAAIAAASAGDVIFLDAQTFTESITINKDITLFGPGASITSASAVTVTITSPCKLLYLSRISNSASGAAAYAVEVNAATSAVLERCTISKASGAPTIGAAVHTVDAVNLELRECIISCSAGTSRYGIYNDPNFSSITIRGGAVSGTTNSIKGTEATSLLILTNLPILSGSVAYTSTLTTGAYADSSGNVLYLDTTGTTGGVWRYRPDGLRIKEATIALAQTNGADGDEVHLFPGTYDLGSGLSLTKRLHFVGEGDPRSIIITGSGNFTLEPTDDGSTFRNLTILNTAGGGTDRTIIQSNVNNCVYENCILTKTGAADDSACILQYGGTGTQIINCELTTTGATKNYAIWNNTATATIEVRGGKLNGSTWDIFGDQAGSSIDLIDPVLVNNLTSFSGTLEGWYFDASGHHYALSLSRSIWTTPSFSVHKNNVDQTGIVTATFTKLTWSTEAYDTHGWFASDKFTPLLAGKYYFNIRVHWQSVIDQIIVYAFLYKNGANAKEFSLPTSGTGGHNVRGTTTIEANGSTDYFEVYVYQPTGTNRDVSGAIGATSFEGVYVGR